MMEYILIAALVLIFILITQFNRMMQWSLKKNNFAGLEPAAKGSPTEQQFYQTYMATHEQGLKPRIKAVTKDIHFDPPIKQQDQAFLEFNLSPTAINNLAVLDEQLSFSGKFSGTVIQVRVPLDSVEWVQSPGHP